MRGAIHILYSQNLILFIIVTAFNLEYELIYFLPFIIELIVGHQLKRGYALNLSILVSAAQK
jgi:hypothetical protein